MKNLGDLSTDEVLKRSSDGDARLKVKFFPKKFKLNFKSKEAGKDIFEMRDYISITIPGQTQGTNIFPVKQTYMDRFPLQWEAYKIDKDQKITGTPIEALPSIGNEHILICKQNNIDTIEQLITVPIEALNDLGPDGQTMVRIGKVFLSKEIDNVSTDNNTESSQENRSSGKPRNSGRKQHQKRRKSTRAVK